MTDQSAPWPKQGPASYFPSIEKRYGRSIAEWQKIIADSGLDKHMAIVTYLKSEYGMGHGHANALVGCTLAGNEPPLDLCRHMSSIQSEAGRRWRWRSRSRGPQSDLAPTRSQAGREGGLPRGGAGPTTGGGAGPTRLRRLVPLLDGARAVGHGTVSILRHPLARHPGHTGRGGSADRRAGVCGQVILRMP